MLTFLGTTARWTPELRYDGSDCFTVFSSKSEEAHRFPFFEKYSLLIFTTFFEIISCFVLIALHVAELIDFSSMTLVTADGLL